MDDWRQRRITQMNYFSGINEEISGNPSPQSRGFVVAPWDGTEETEQKIKEDTRATIRLLPFEREDGKDLVSGKPGRTAIFARAY